MDKITFAIIILGFTLNTMAMNLNDWEKLVVKVKSFPCATRNPVYEGSGVILKDNKVITSEHVLMPKSAGDICYEVKNSFIGNQKANLVKNDFRSGLAKLSLVKDLEVPTALIDYDLTRSKEIIALGFPKGSSTLQILDDGKVRSLKGSRALIPDIKNMIEVSNIPVEYGMSGGVLISQSGNGLAFAGTLTHQYLQRNAGSETTVVNANEQLVMTSHDLAIGIRSQDVIDWSHSNANNPLIWERAMNTHKESSFGAMNYGPFSFEKKVIDSSTFMMGGADGVGIGGKDDDDDDDENRLLGIEIKLNDELLSQFSESDLNSPILKNWYQWLLRGETLTIVQLSSDHKNHSITSFDQLVTLWERDGFRPLVIRGKIESLDSKVNEVFSLTRKLRSSFSLLKENTTNRNTKVWIDFYLNKLLMIENNIGNRDDLKVFEQSFAQEFWDDIYMTSFDKALVLEDVRLLVTN
jgi:hypothetical protein